MSRFAWEGGDVEPVVCAGCVHLRRGSDFVCAAFPAGIPVPILRGERDHLTPYDGDGGILYEKREP